MTAAPVRLAQLDVQAPGVQLAASGNVEVNGSADLPRSGPPRARSADTTLTPARQALANHQAHLVNLAAEVERVSRPVSWLRDKLAAAQAELQATERVLTQIERQHTADLAAAARDGTTDVVPPPDSAKAETAVARAVRNVNSVRQAMAEVQGDQVRASDNLEQAKSRFEPLALACLVEDYIRLATTYHEARSRYFDSEAEVLGLLEAIGQHGRDLEQKSPGRGIPWLRQLEQLRSRDGKPPAREFGPHDIGVAASRWNAVIHRLQSDSSASF